MKDLTGSRFHNVKRWRIGKRNKLFSDSWTRQLVIELEGGTRVEIALFAEDKSKLAPYSDSEEEMLEEQAKEVV